MIISQTPYRVSLFGGGTDYPAWFCKHGGICIGMAIDKYCYLSLRKLPPFFEHNYRVAYSKIELTKQVNEIEHPAVRAILSEHQIPFGLEIHHDGDLPSKSGLGSSSSFSVGLINAVCAFQGKHVSPKYLAKEAIRIERNVIGEVGGYQDQIWAAHGGLNVISIDTDGEYEVSPMLFSEAKKQSLLSHLLLFYTGTSRFSSEISRSKIKNIERKAENFSRVQQLADEALSILTSENLDFSQLGKLLDESWKNKRSMSSSVSNAQIDAIYEAAKFEGALGGKVLGAGGGGFVLIFAEPKFHSAIRNRLCSLVEVSFGISSTGSKIVVYEPSGF